MDIRWTTEASSNLEQISLRIAEDKPEAALKTVAAIFERIEQLVSFPRRGRIGREKGTRELVLSPLPYIAVYRVRESAIEILHIRHGAQDRD
jgi:plasmid stabilization system protein ParE